MSDSTTSQRLNHQREVLLKFIASRENKGYEYVLREYRGIPAPGDNPRLISSNLYNNVETAVALMKQDETISSEHPDSKFQKEIEEATALELPMLEKNLVFLSTIASVATLLGLFGTVLGMIRAFAAMANAGAPDATALSTGISEALINTALGIGTLPL